MDILLEWIGTVVLLGLLLVLVPVFFMMIITLEFRLTDMKPQDARRPNTSGTHSPHGEAAAPLPSGTNQSP